MTWIPDMASIETEELMEEKDLPEEDRDEIRRFAEFLRLRKEKGIKNIAPEMKQWLLGKE